MTATANVSPNEAGSAIRRQWPRVPDSLAPVFLLSPAMLFILVFTLLPTAASLALALFKWNPLKGSATFVGFDNFARLFESGELWNSIRITLTYAVVVVPCALVLALVIALLIQNSSLGAHTWRLIFFLPMAATFAAAAVAWRFVFYPGGLFDSTIGEAIGAKDLLSNPDHALWALTIIGIWRGAAFATLIYVAGLNAVPKTPMEAAHVDGANAWQRFWAVTWPALGPSTVFAIITSSINAFSVFDPVVILTMGGPVHSTETLTFLLWNRGINIGDLGGGAVVSVTLSLIVVGVAVFQIRGIGTRLEDKGRA
jgi:multiple sugar transport system permease protein